MLFLFVFWFHALIKTTLLNICVRGTMQIKKKMVISYHPETHLSWYQPYIPMSNILPMMSAVFRFFIDFLTNWAILSQSCINSRLSKILKLETHKLPLNQSMLFLGYCLFLQLLSTILSNYLTLGCFSFTLYVPLEACCKYQYTLLDIIPVISFHMTGKHEIGWQLPTALLWP